MTESMFQVLKVDEENVRMSKFVRNKLGSFEKGKAFFELTEKEDLPFCRKAMREQNTTLKVNIVKFTRIIINKTML